ncbi:DNA (cytosine-5-)-methyltransferase [Nostoc sp. 3335mG]|nr:DNA (cytosine-5-)-methyltransferase [Nostoc sp. 3335mG]
MCPGQVKRARSLRGNMSDAENRLWYHLRDRRLAGFKFVRQFPIDHYYADFACREAMLVVEADGGQHTSERDGPRDRVIQGAGYTVLRFWNHDILNSTSMVLEIIHNALDSCVPSPLRGEGQGEGSFRPNQISE